MSSQMLTLTEYSTKYNVSISTLRRRIKADQIEYSFEDGKYLIKDQSLGRRQSPKKVASASPAQPVTSAPPQQEVRRENRPEVKQEAKTPAVVGPSNDGSTTQQILTELKSAYRLILQEKEEQIIQLKDEAADLKTLVRVLEEHNLTLKKEIERIEPPRRMNSKDIWFDENLDIDISSQEVDLKDY